MKEISFLLAFTLVISYSFAQVQRNVKSVAPVGSAVVVTTESTADANGGKMKIMKELNLTKEQKSKLKELKQDGKEKKDVIQNNGTLKAEEKEARLKELRKEQAKNTLDILNEEQKEQLKKMRKDKKANKTEGTENQ
jgi:hypothetical protein